MANRFLDTNYYKSPFVRSLPGKLKSLYSFIICDCDGAGIWNMDMQAASMFIGFDVTQKEFEEAFTKNGKAVNLGGMKFFFPDFIEHQYPGGLQINNKAHKNFINTLTKYGLIDNCQKIIKKEAPLEEPLKGSHVQSSNGNGQGNGLGNGNGNSPKDGGLGEEKYIIPQMCKIWYETFPTYTQDREKDCDGMGKILWFIAKQHHLKRVEETETQIKILNTLQLIADQVNREPFWTNKPIKSIANNIQEFYNNIKNPINGKQSGTAGNQPTDLRAGVQAERDRRRAQRQQTGN
jgi:hypothetical protein